MTLLYMLFAGVSQIAFMIVSGMFTLIDDLSKYNFFSADTINQFTNKVYVIIGVLMLFKLVISAVQYIVNPDMFDDKSKGLVAVLRKSIIAVILLAIVPSIFQFAMEVQGDIVEQIPKIIFGNRGTSVDQMGDQLSVSVMGSFLVVKDDKTGLPTRVLNGPGDFYAVAMDGCSANFLAPDFWSGDACFYNVWWILLVPVAGVFLIYILASLAIDVATRSIKFGIVQILAPIPITSYIVDEKKLTNWATTSVQIYTDLFIRLGIIYLIIYIVQVVLKDMFTSAGYDAFRNSVSQSVGRTPGGMELVLIKILIIVALLLFAKNAPKFITDLLGLKGAGDGFNDMFKRAGGLFGTTLGGWRTARSNYTTQKERYAGKGYGRGRQIAEGLRSAAAGAISATGRGLFMSGQGKGFNDVRKNSFKAAIDARNKRIDKNDNIIRTDVPEYIEDQDGNRIKNPEYYTRSDYRRDVRREKLGIPSDTAFIKERHSVMDQTGKAAADAKSRGVSKANETPDRYKVGLNLGRDANGQYKDANAAIVYNALGFESLDMEQVRNLYTMAKNGSELETVDHRKVRLNDEQIKALGAIVQTIEKRTSYLKEAELMGTGDPGALPDAEKIRMLISNNRGMYNSPEIMNVITKKFSKYGISVGNVEDILSQIDVLKSRMQTKMPVEPIYEGIAEPTIPQRPVMPTFTMTTPVQPTVPILRSGASDVEQSQYAADMEQYKIDLANYNQEMKEFNKAQSEYNQKMADYNQAMANYPTLQANYNAQKAQYDADITAYNQRRSDYENEYSSWIAEVNKRADILNAVKDAYEEVAKVQFPNAQFAETRAKKAQQAISNNEKKS